MADLSEKTYEELKSLDENSLYENLSDLASRVYGRYYLGYSSYKDDLIQEAVLKGWTLIDEGNFDSSRSSIYNYLFTGMRNQMTNYLKKIRDVQLSEALPETCGEEDPDYNSWEIIIKEFSDLEARSKILFHVEGENMINFWDDVSEKEKDTFLKMVSKKTKLKDAQTVFEHSGDIILWMMFLFHGRKVEFPPESILEKYLRQVRIYYSLQKGLTPEEVGKKYGIRVQHISRIKASVEAVLVEEVNNE